ncbi:MAG: glycosyltransferase family 4 protein [Actinomycetota bacterium]
MKLAVLTPHFAPDVAPTGAVVTRIVEELAVRGHRIEVYTSLPWYRGHRIESGYEGRLTRREDLPWGSVTRIHPFPAPDKRALVLRGAAFGAFTTLVTAIASRGGDLDGVLAVSPPLPLGFAGARVAKARRAPFVFNIQDVFPDVVIELGFLKNPLLIAAARRLERYCYRRADAITVLSEELRENVVAKVDDSAKVRVIPNFVDTDVIAPTERDNAYRAEFGLTGKKVVMYAGNVGLSQPVDLLLDAATALAYEPDLVFVINGAGARRAELERRARDMTNVVFVDMQPIERLPEVLAAADIHVVALKRGLARASVPSKSYSILAAGRPLIASVDDSSAVAEMISGAGAGIAVPPEDAEAFTKAVRKLLDDPDEAERMGRAGRTFVESTASPAAIAGAYEQLFAELT